ncbi:MAG: hypothetical protein OEW75_02755 [Cyclobacteriaceae bacterium]|nr:hypothetical protein [Cyclobacteriaceae bacterium]
MKKIKLVLTVALIGLMGMSTAQSMKEKLAAKMASKMEKSSKSGGKYKTYDFTDASGISGTYFLNDQIIDRQNTAGFRYTKEKDGNIINNLYVELGGKGYGDRPNSMTFQLKEKYKTKYDFNYFYLTDKDCPNLANNQDEWLFVEISKDIYGFSQNGKVLCVASKDSANFSDYDTETAQVLYDQKMAKVNTEAMEKETAVWMKNAVYSKNVGKIVFAAEDWQLMKRGYENKPPMVNGKDFKTVLDMAGNMNYMAFFKFPPNEQFPGQEINIEFEMGGIKTNRTESRAKSASWQNMIKRIETKDFAYRQHSPKALRTYSQYNSQWIQDYAFMHLIYQNKDKFMMDEEYDLTVRMYSSRDGENGELIAEGVVKLKYTPKAHLAYAGDPDHPEKTSVFTFFEEFLDE